MNSGANLVSVWLAKIGYHRIGPVDYCPRHDGVEGFMGNDSKCEASSMEVNRSDHWQIFAVFIPAMAIDRQFIIVRTPVSFRVAGWFLSFPSKLFQFLFGWPDKDIKELRADFKINENPELQFGLHEIVMIPDRLLELGLLNI